MVKFIGAKYAITATSTAAIHFSFKCYKIKKGDKILMSVNSFFCKFTRSLRHFDTEPILLI